MYIANVAEDGFEKTTRTWMHGKGHRREEGERGSGAVCSKIEAEIAELEDGEEKDMFLESLGLEGTLLNRVIVPATACSTCRPTSPPG